MLAKVQYILGDMYYYGNEVLKDLEKAAYWFEKSSENGDVEAKSILAKAQLKLGKMYEYGDDGVLKDYEKAAHWYKKAAENGDAEAQYNLGWLYDHGKGVSEDYEDCLLVRESNGAREHRC